MTRIIASIVASAVTMFGLAGLFTGVIARGFIRENVDPALLRNPPNLVLTFTGFLFLACLMAWAYRRFVPIVTSPARSGLQLGIAFAVVWLMPYSVVLFSVYNFPYAALGIDMPWALVEQGLGGLVMALVQGRRAHA